MVRQFLREAGVDERHLTGVGLNYSVESVVVFLRSLDREGWLSIRFDYSTEVIWLPLR